jgi:hypothetical protein
MRAREKVAGFALLCGAHGLATGQVGGTRAVDVIEVSERGNNVDVTVQFGCSMRYITHLPAAEGTELRVQLQPLPDCGAIGSSAFTTELPPVSGGGEVVDSARVESTLPGQLSLIITWRKSERFVLGQGADRHGLRIRLFDHTRRPSVSVSEPGDVISSFAVNLDSQIRPFEPATVQAIGERLHAPVFVSEVTVDGQKWYRLRAGPFTQRAQAERVLEAALPNYPRAWLAIGDDTITSAPAGAAPPEPLPQVQRPGTDAPLDPVTLQRMLAEAEAALGAQDYARAVTVLTALQRQDEFPHREHAQELLGLARERAGQLAHAEAEYEEYLRRYPNGPGAERVANRLRVLREASSAAVQTGTGGGRPTTGWTFNGGVGQMARYDGTRVQNTFPAGTVAAGVPTSASTSSDILFNDVDLVARHRGQSLDFLTRLSAGYARDFSPNSVGTMNGTMTRVTLASAEITDGGLGLRARLGRQMRNEDGILGTFDGLFVSYQFLPGLSVNLAGGLPVEQLNTLPQTNHRFESAALDYAPSGAHWDASVFGEKQTFDGYQDRKAVGFELRYLAPHASLVGLTDYDLFYHSLNIGALIGTVQLPLHWTVSVDAERRNSPILSLNSSLIGQPVTTIAEMLQTFTLQQTYQFARDRTALTSEYSLTATHPLGDRFQFAVTTAVTQTGATPASGGVDATLATGLDKLVQAQLYGQSVWWQGDFQVITAQYAKTEVGTLESIGITTRFPLVGAWRIGPRFTVDRQVLASDNSRLLSFLPSALIDYQRGRSLAQFEFGGELGSRQSQLVLQPTNVPQQTQNTTRYYVSLSYRVNF